MASAVDASAAGPVLIFASISEAVTLARGLELVEAKRRADGVPVGGLLEFRQRLEAVIEAIRLRASDGTSAISANASAIDHSNGNRGLLSVADAAVLLDVGDRRVLQFIADGQLQARRSGRAWRIRREDVEALRRLRAGPDGPQSRSPEVEVCADLAVAEG